MKWLIKRFFKDEILNETVKELYNTIGADDIVKEEDGVLMFKGKPLNKGEQQLLTSEAKTFLNMMLWKVLQTDIKYRANRAMFEKAKSEMDITAGKLWLYTLDCIQQRLEELSDAQ